MPSYRKRGTSWQAIVRKSGKTHTKTFPTKLEARNWATDLEIQLQATTSIGSLEKRTMFEILDKYKSEVVPTLSDPRKDASYINFLQSFAWMRIPLNSLNDGLLAEWRDLRYETCTPKTVHTNFTLFKTALNYAKADEKIINLFTNIKLRRITGRAVPRLEKWDEGELIRFANASKVQSYLGPMITFALETGMRRGEMLKLDWDMIDAERGWINLPGHITKTGKPRQIPITTECYNALNGLKILMKEKGKVTHRPNPAFLTSEGKKRVWQVTSDGLRKAFECARQKAGLEHLHWHDLRHEAISRFFDMGLTLPEVQSISGHSTPEELSRYSHASGQSILDKIASKKGGWADA